jgi:hypothetical protein
VIGSRFLGHGFFAIFWPTLAATVVGAGTITVLGVLVHLPARILLWIGAVFIVTTLAVAMTQWLRRLHRRLAKADRAIESMESRIQKLQDAAEKDRRNPPDSTIELHELRLADVLDAARAEGFIVDRRIFEGTQSLFIATRRGDHRSYLCWDNSRNDVIESLREMGATLDGLALTPETEYAFTPKMIRA